jgi:hypothetical protein
LPRLSPRLYQKSDEKRTTSKYIKFGAVRKLCLQVRSDPIELLDGRRRIAHCRKVRGASQLARTPARNHEAIVNLIASTTITKGLRVRAALDTDEYPTGVKVEDATMTALHPVAAPM